MAQDGIRTHPFAALVVRAPFFVALVSLVLHRRGLNQATT